VLGHNIHNCTLWERKKVQDVELSKLLPIITVNSLDDATELSQHPNKEVRKLGEGVRLTAEGKGLEKMREII
jgi:hypothetical protein